MLPTYSTSGVRQMKYSQLEKLGRRYPKRINNKLVKLKFANNPSIWILDLFLNGTIFLLLILIARKSIPMTLFDENGAYVLQLQVD